MIQQEEGRSEERRGLNAPQVGFGPLDWFRPQASCDNLIDSPFSDDAPFARLAAVVSQDGTSASERSAWRHQERRGRSSNE
ncbi:hypothetical protein MKX08_006319 [Trichoderma sp. CBMAI-0020]|nr:hypothetical protein MKX08_006319 [Trichoderma sp. CBMAI-0020]